MMNTIPVMNTRIRGRSPLISPAQLRIDIPQTDEQMSFIHKSRATIEDILSGKDDRMIVVVGPCSIHDKETALEYARRLKSLSDDVKDRYFLVMRTYFEKPRTTIGWKGLINDPHINGTNDINVGLHLARSILRECTDLGIPCATEYVDSLIIPDYTAEFISWTAIGARTVESPQHRQLASGLSMPVGFKNDRSGNVDVAIDAVLTARDPHTFLGVTDFGGVAIVATSGNNYTHIVLRGGREPNYEHTHITDALGKLHRANLPEILMIDCSHGNSKKDYRNQPEVFLDLVRQHRDGNKGIIGAMLESNINEGNHKIPDDLTSYKKSEVPYGVSITDSCLGWNDTQNLIKNC